MPYPRQADNDRSGGWSLMSRLFLATKRKGQRNDQVILISANCPALISSIPLLMRNPKDLSDVLKTDESTARIEMDTADAFRYALKSKLEPGKKPKAVENEEKLRAMQESGLDGHSLNIYRIQLSQEVRTSEEPARLGHGRVGRRM